MNLLFILLTPASVLVKISNDLKKKKKGRNRNVMMVVLRESTRSTGVKEEEYVIEEITS